MDNFTPLRSPAKKKKKVNKLLIFGNLFLVIIMAFAGYFYYNNVLLTKEQKATGEPRPCEQSEILACTEEQRVCEGMNRLECKIPRSGGDTGSDWCLIDANGCVDGKKASGFPSCWSETPSTPSLQCGSPGSPGAIYDTNFRGTCAQYFPALWAGPGGNCQINCLCCPTGSTYICTDSGTTYEIATTTRKKYMCTDLHHDKYISSKPNPAYNSAIPPEDNPLCTEGTHGNGNTVWNCLDTLTTCMQNVCSCGGVTVPTATPTPTPTSPPGCSPRYFCFKADGRCESSNQTTYTDDGDVQCGGGPTCAQNLATYQTGKTTGICYRSMDTCVDNCIGPSPTPTPTGIITNSPTPTRTPTPTSTPTSTPTATPIISNTPTATPVISNTPTSTPTATNTPTSTPVLTNTPGPSATPTEIILAQISASPTTTTQLLQTGVIKSFLYWIPAIIILVGLIL